MFPKHFYLLLLYDMCIATTLCTLYVYSIGTIEPLKPLFNEFQLGNHVMFIKKRFNLTKKIFQIN